MNLTSPVEHLFITSYKQGSDNYFEYSFDRIMFPGGSFLEIEFIPSHYRLPQCPLESIVPVYTPGSWG